MTKYASIVAAVCVAAGICLAADAAATGRVSPQARAQAQTVFQSAERAARLGDSFRAYLLYSQAARLDPSNALYGQRRAAVQSSPGLTGPRTETAQDPAIETTAAHFMAEGLTQGEILEAGRAEGPARLEGKSGKQNFDLRGDSRTVIERVASAYGIQVIFDGGYQPLPAIRFQANDVDAGTAIRILETATDSFFVPMSGSLALIARETQANRTQFTPTMSVAVPIPERMSTQEAQELTAAVQQAVEIRRISLDGARRMVYFRDTVSKALTARAMFLSLSRPRAQVEVELELVSVNRTSSLGYGLGLPTASSIVDFGKSIGGFQLNPPASTGTNYFAFGGGATLMGLGIGNALALATLTKASGDTLLRSQIVALDGQATTLHIGDRYPIITGSFSSLTPDQQVSEVLAPTINYQDLGVQLKVTPVVHDGGEVTLDVDAQFKTLGVVGANGIPSIGSRQYQGKVRMKTGEWAVLAGLVSVSEANTTDGIAGLSNIPGVGKALRRNTKAMDTSETLILLKPRIVILPPWDEPPTTLWIGTETRPLSAF